MKAKVSKGAGSDAWWSAPAAGWSEVGDEMYEHWKRFSRSKPRLDEEVALRALQFGHGARSAYGEHMPWEDVLGPLEKDWQKADEGVHPWADVHQVVKVGWVGAANLEPIRGDSMAAAREPDKPREESNVPGGRPDR